MSSNYNMKAFAYFHIKIPQYYHPSGCLFQINLIRKQFSHINVMNTLLGLQGSPY